ncbi:MAG: GHKL domain-containing protein [Lachnospiraceae bacterium]|nr:GHKL domain-containing protein [Lachnospiraceae bacterium]
MVENYIEWGASLVDCFIVVRFLERWLPFRHDHYKGCATGILFFLLALDNIFLSQKNGAENVSILIMLVLISLYSFWLQRGRVYEKLLEIILPTITLFPINGIVLYAVSFVSEENIDVLRSSGGELRILVLFFSKFAFFVICEIVIKLKRNETSSILSFQWVLQILCFVISFYIANTIWSISKQKPVDNYDVLFAFLLIALLNILLFILLNRMENSSRLREKYNLAQMNLEIQKQFILNAQKRYQETNILRHDMKHYLMTAASLISNGDPEDAKLYLETILKEKLPLTSAGVQTGVVAVDSVINMKLSICREKGIAVKVIINTEFQEIDEMDMSILLANLLDNAMNGCKNSDEPRINLEIARKKSYIQIIVQNSILDSVLSDNPDLNTTKAEKSMHGYGIESIRKISSKYDGTVNFSEEEKMFIAEIWLHLELPK